MQAIVKLFYKQFTVSHDPVKASSSEDILHWFNEQLIYYGQARWSIRGIKWKNIKARLNLTNITWGRCGAVNSKHSVSPQLPTLHVKRKLFEEY